MAKKTAKARKTTKKPSRSAPKKTKASARQANGQPKPNGTELMSMDDAIKVLKTTRSTFYRWLREGRINGMKVGRQWRFERAEIDRFLRGDEPQIELRTDIGPLIKELRARLGGEEEVHPKGYSPVKLTVNLMFRLAAKMGASDIHLLPGEEAVDVSYRVDGVLHPTVHFDRRLLAPIVERWKYMANLDTRQRSLPQDGRIGIDLNGVVFDLRVSFLPSIFGESLTARILRRDVVLLELGALDYSAKVHEKLVRHLEAPTGVVLTTGPTGSGKTTTLYACLQHLVNPGVKILSIEDPVEYIIPGVVQVGVDEEEGMTFERAQKYFLRSDPDVILVGEIRSRSSAEVCMQAALTGHLVLTSLHTNNATSVPKRLADIGVAPFLIADATRAVLAQRLVRRLCKVCSKPMEPSPNDLARAEKMARDGGLDWDSLAKGFREPVGCDECRNLGYRNRAAIVELLEVRDDVAKAVRDGASADVLRKIAVAEGMTTMGADGVRRAAAGQVALSEVFRVAPRGD